VKRALDKRHKRRVRFVKDKSFESEEVFRYHLLKTTALKRRNEMKTFFVRRERFQENGQTTRRASNDAAINSVRRRFY